MLRSPAVRNVFKQKISLSPWFISLLIACILLMLSLGRLNSRIRPVLAAMAQTEVGNAVTVSVNNAVMENIAAEHVSYHDVVEMKTDSNGRIAAISSNLERINSLRGKLLASALEAVSGLSENHFYVPIGNLTEIDILSGRGPQIAVRVLSTGTASANFSHQFLEAGVNQTLHQIVLDIEVLVKILLPGETIQLPVDTHICIAETIIVGEVPNTYLELENGYQYGHQNRN